MEKLTKEEKAKRDQFSGELYTKAYNAIPPKIRYNYGKALKKLREIGRYIYDDELERYIVRVSFNNEHGNISVLFRSDVCDGTANMRIYANSKRKVFLYNNSDRNSYLLKAYGAFGTKHIRSVLMDVLVCFCCGTEEMLSLYYEDDDECVEEDEMKSFCDELIEYMDEHMKKNKTKK